MRMTISLLLLIVVHLPARAQQVYKCVGGSHVSYQSQPCEPTQRIARQWDATPETEAPQAATDPPKAPSTSRKASKPRTSRRPPTSRTRRTAANPLDKRCEAAKARREAKLKAVGLKRTFDLLRKLDDAVYDACR